MKCSNTQDSNASAYRQPFDAFVLILADDDQVSHKGLPVKLGPTHLGKAFVFRHPANQLAKDRTKDHGNSAAICRLPLVNPIKASNDADTSLTFPHLPACVWQPMLPATNVRLLRASTMIP